MIRNILEYLEHTAARLPEKTAFSAGEDRISFAELETAAKKIGSYLLRFGGRNQPVFHVGKSRKPEDIFLEISQVPG